MDWALLLVLNPLRLSLDALGLYLLYLMVQSIRQCVAVERLPDQQARLARIDAGLAAVNRSARLVLQRVGGYVPEQEGGDEEDGMLPGAPAPEGKEPPGAG